MLKEARVTPPVLQFGTSRFLLAHADLFISQALERGEALGGITVVQTTQSAASAARVAALADGRPYPVRLRGLRDGAEVDEIATGAGVRGAVHADTHWPWLRDAVSRDVQVILSNTGDRGYELDARDDVDLLDRRAPAPRSFPAKLLVLLHARWLAQCVEPLSIYPCELVSRNGDTLRDLVCALGEKWRLGSGFTRWMNACCTWANSLVDRIVSAPLHPVGAIAEPYALWAIEQQEGLVLPCRHPAIVVTNDLQRYERLKLFVLNLGHTMLVQHWLDNRGPADMSVRQAMLDTAMRAELEAAWAQEVLPVFEALGQGMEAHRYVAIVRDRLLNPYLDHRLSDIAQAHAQKKLRRLEPVVDLALQLGLGLPQCRLRQALASPG
jgi:tagaturonate reductase